MIFYYIFLASIVLVQISTSAQQAGYDYNQPNQRSYQQNNYPSGLGSTASSGRLSEPYNNYDNTNNNYATTGFSNDNNGETLSSQLPLQNSNDYYNNDNDSENIIIAPKNRYNNQDHEDRPVENGNGAVNGVLNDNGNGNEGDKNGFSAIPGLPGVDYPVYSEIPKTSFVCGDKTDGFYADVEAKCQLFHRCVNNVQYDFLCPNGTIYNQQHLVCVWWNEFDCETAPSFFDRNDLTDSDSNRFGEKSSDNKDLTAANFPNNSENSYNNVNNNDNNNGSNENPNSNNFQNGAQTQEPSSLRSGKSLFNNNGDFVPSRQSKIALNDFNENDDSGDNSGNDGNIDYDGESLLTAEGDFSRNTNSGYNDGRGNDNGSSGSGGGDGNFNGYSNENTKNNRFRNNNYREGSFLQRKPTTGFGSDYSQQQQQQRQQQQQQPKTNYRTDRLIQPPSKLYLPPLV